MTLAVAEEHSDVGQGVREDDDGGWEDEDTEEGEGEEEGGEEAQEEEDGAEEEEGGAAGSGRLVGGDGRRWKRREFVASLLLAHPFPPGGVDRSYESAPFNPLLHESKLKSTYFLLMSRKIAR